MNRATTLYAVGPRTGTTMQSCASAAKLRSGRPILPIGMKAKGLVGNPPPRTVAASRPDSTSSSAALAVLLAGSSAAQAYPTRTIRVITNVDLSPSALDGKKLAAFSATGGRFLRFPIGDRRCNRTRASVGNAGGNARPSLTNATLAASPLLHGRPPTAPCSKGLAAASRLIVAASTA